MNASKLAALATLSACSLSASLFAQLTQRVSVGAGGAQGNSFSSDPAISADGHYVAFRSEATNLVAGDTNALWDIFVRNRLTGTTERVSVATGGTQANGDSEDPSISADGRYVAFLSAATNLVAGDTNGSFDLFVRDRQTGTTERVSLDSGGSQVLGSSQEPSISGNGRFVAFRGLSPGFVPGDTNGFDDVFVRDRQLGTTERVSVGPGGAQGNDDSFFQHVSDDGRYVVFSSEATNLVAGDTNAKTDVFVRDRQLGTTERVSLGAGGAQANDFSWADLYSSRPITPDGRYVAFYSSATNLVVGDTNAFFDVFVRDRQLGTTARVSVASGGGQGNNVTFGGELSTDGRFVAFYGPASTLVAGDTNIAYDVFVHDRQSGATSRVSVHSSGAQGDNSSREATLSADGRYVAFWSLATNLVAGDTNADIDVFVHDRGMSGFTSFCDPGTTGVIACPCSNPPSGAGRGCNNSAATGGASLSASGLAYLSSDTLVFTTSGEKPTALSTVWQGPTVSTTGLVFGQGVRCVNGTLKRLYNKNAVGGSITAPDFGAADPTISARSAALNVPIQPGESRYYFVSYRDPVILGGCPAVATFDATQAGRVDWSM